MQPAGSHDAVVAPAEIEAARAAIRSALGAAGLDLVPHAERPLATWLALLFRWRRRRSIAGPRTLDGLATEAVADSLFGDSILSREGTLIDVGSGAGIPGIALAAVGQGRRVTLVESSPVRCGLLRFAVAAAGLGNVDIVASRAEDVAREMERGRRAPADAAISRAFLPPDEWLALAVALVRPGGTVAVMASSSWPGPAGALGLSPSGRRDYRLPGRRPRAAMTFTTPVPARE